MCASKNTVERCIIDEEHNPFRSLLDVGFQLEYLLLAAHVNEVLQRHDFRRLLRSLAGVPGHLLELVADAVTYS